MLSNQPQMSGVGSTPYDTHSVNLARIDLRKNKILVDSFKQVAGGTDLASPG
jgi:hypothetical protein